jgi:precorrin-2/cobalt-factor-2 C20-methyltransferase
MSQIVYSIGIGTGDPELITLKAKRLMEESDIVFVPQSSSQGKSVAREIVRNYIPDSKVHMYYFPMNNDQQMLSEKYAELARQINILFNEGKKVSYVTMGDPTIFSTSNYLSKQLNILKIPVEHIPGIATLNAASTKLGLPLSVKGENFAVYEMPGETKIAVELIQRHSTIVFMKVNKKLPVLLESVKKANPDIAYLTRRMGLDNEAVFDLTSDGDLPDSAYLSVAIIKHRRNPYCGENLENQT